MLIVSLPDASRKSPRFSNRLRCCNSIGRKYRHLFSSAGTRRKPGPKGPSEDLVTAIVELKSRNRSLGYQRIVQQISHAFGVEIDMDVVRRVLAMHYRPEQPNSIGPSWLTFLAHTKDSLWSVDLFRCESILLRTYVSGRNVL